MAAEVKPPAGGFSGYTYNICITVTAYIAVESYKVHKASV